jgi:hypothetical protein
MQGIEHLSEHPVLELPRMAPPVDGGALGQVTDQHRQPPPGQAAA